MLWMFQRVMYGEVTNPKNQGLKDLSKREWAVLLPILLFIIWIGVYPTPFLRTTSASVHNLLQQIDKKYELVVAKEKQGIYYLSRTENIPPVKATD
jgi:NADH-quinone oxidoreductase subunit M